ncbi:MAG: cation-translocating P-type ATPase [Desulforhopalus sp.]
MNNYLQGAPGEDKSAKERGGSTNPFYALPVEEVLALLNVNQAEGLSAREVEKRREKYGPNELQEETKPSPLLILVNQFKSIVILILVVAALAAFATARWPEALALVAVTLVNTVISFFTEYKAARSMEALRLIGQQKTSVRRQGKEMEIVVSELVPGDIVLLVTENLIPADLRLIGTAGGRVNEAALTGESVPVQKSPDSVAADEPLHSRTCMLYKGTTLEEGQIEGVVTATGLATELGRISKLTAGAEDKTPPLQKRLDQLGRRLAWITLSIAAIVGAAGLAAGRDTLLMIETAIALGIAAIPEGLPIVATIALARGMWLMARHNALVNQLAAVEALGATTVIFTDKTGTLTENAMAVKELVTPIGVANEGDEQGQTAPQEQPAEKSSLLRLLKVGVLCSNAEPGDDGYSGDPTEVALLEAASGEGLHRQDLLREMEEVREEPFDSERMLMATFHRLKGKSGEAYYVAVKGAPHAVLEACDRVLTVSGSEPMSDNERKKWTDRADELAAGGLRLLMFADKEVDDSSDDPYTRLRFDGLAAMEDPPRTDVREAIEQCQAAGIRVVMVTGDRGDTGSAIGEKVGLDSADKTFLGHDLGEPGDMTEQQRRRLENVNIFARVTPEQKFRLVKLYQDSGQIVAMTGDGVNDAPALKQADIGIAMGKRGTDAAKQVADMVLRDDNFSTIVAAVRQGRIIFANIRKSVIFMLCTNIAEVMVVALASLAQLPIPLHPLQILYLNVLTDVFPALALGVGRGSADVMKHPPRRAEESVLTRHHWCSIAGWSVVIGVHVLGALSIALYYLGFEEQRAVTVSFLTLALAKLWFVLNLRDRGTAVLRNDVIGNKWMWGAWILCLLLLLAAVYWGPLSSVLQTIPPGIGGWAVVVALSIVPALLSMLIPGIRFYSAPK